MVQAPKPGDLVIHTVAGDHGGVGVIKSVHDDCAVVLFGDVEMIIPLSDIEASREPEA